MDKAWSETNVRHVMMNAEAYSQNRTIESPNDEDRSGAGKVYGSHKAANDFSGVRFTLDQFFTPHPTKTYTFSYSAVESWIHAEWTFFFFVKKRESSMTYGGDEERESTNVKAATMRNVNWANGFWIKINLTGDCFDIAPQHVSQLLPIFNNFLCE